MSRIAVIAVIVEKKEATERLNAILHDYGEYIIGRMGVPYKQKGVNIISIAIDAPEDVIARDVKKALEGLRKIGALDE